MTVALAATIGACAGRTLSLGDKEPRRYHFEPPRIVAELASSARTDNPTLTAETQDAPPPMSGDEKRLTVILLAAVVLWATDCVHEVYPGWIGLAAGLSTLMPGVGVMPITAFSERVKNGDILVVDAFAVKAPKTIHFVAELPRNAAGKVSRAAVRSMLGG